MGNDDTNCKTYAVLLYIYTDHIQALKFESIHGSSLGTVHVVTQREDDLKGKTQG